MILKVLKIAVFSLLWAVEDENLSCRGKGWEGGGLSNEKIGSTHPGPSPEHRLIIEHSVLRFK